MNNWIIIIGIYLLSVVSLALFLTSKKARAKGRLANDKLEKVFAVIAILFAPIVWIIGLVVYLSSKPWKDKGKVKEQPRPLPKNLRGKLKKDLVLFQNRTMSIAEVNRITGKKYTLEQIYGRKYVASLSEEEMRQFDDGKSNLQEDDNIRKDEPAYSAIKRFVIARMNGKFESIRDLFAPEVTLVVYERETRRGVDSTLAFWHERYDSSLARRVKFDYRIVPCMLYNGIAIEEMPERFAPMLISFRFQNGKIIGMGLAPKFLNPEFMYYGGFREAPYTEEYFKQYVTSDLESEANRIPCPNCGMLSENLEWHTFDNDDIKTFYGYRGVVSVCPHCHRTVEIRPEERYDIPEVVRQKKSIIKSSDEQKEPSSRVPVVSTIRFEYSTPLAGTEFVECLDNTKKLVLDIPLNGPDGEPRTAKKCAEDFHPLLISQLSNRDPETFSQIVECYRKAFLLGNVEAGNNLGILYVNYADRADDGLEILKACARRGNANAIANCFSVLWNEEDDHSEAVTFALTSPALPSPLCCNLAVLYMRGPGIAGNPLPVDKKKAKDYLNMVAEGKALPVGDTEDTELWRRKAERLLPIVDGFDEFSDTARDYVDIAIPRCVRSTKKWGFSFGLEHDLHRELRHFSIPKELSLHLSLASQEHNDHGDISRFFLSDKENNIICSENEILYQLNVEKSVYGAWDVYLFSKARHLLPTWWHGGYNHETLIFSPEDLANVPSQKGRALEVIIGEDDLKPHIRLEGNTAIVDSCYWTEWGGLYREEVTISFDGNSVSKLERTGTRNIYNYDCGIMF